MRYKTTSPCGCCTSIIADNKSFSRRGKETMIRKHVLCPQRLRKTPPQFSWLDHRLVRQDHIRRCDCRGWALYLLLVTVGDAEGLSYYSDTRVADLLSMDGRDLRDARRQLLEADLIAYERPLYQVLSLGGAR